MNHGVISPVMFTEFVDLGMAIVTAGNAIIRSRGLNLFVFYFSIGKALVFKPGLQETAAPTAAIIIRPVGLHIHKVFLPHHGFDHKSQVFGNGITIALSDDLTGILYREFDFQLFIPI